MSDKLSIEIEAKGAREATAAVEALGDALAATKAEARGIFAKGLSESLPEQLQDVAKGFRIAGDGSASLATRLQGGAGAALIAKNAIGDLAGRMVDLTRSLGEATAIQEQQQRALRALGTEYVAVRDATAGTITASEALAMRQSLLRAGFEANSDTMARVSRLGREYAQTYGGTATQAVEQFVSAVQSGDANALQPFGVRIATMKNATDRMAAAVDQLGERFSRVEAHARTAAEENQAFERGLTSLRTGAIATLNVALGGTLTSFRNAAIALGDWMAPQAGVADGADRASRALETQAAAARTTATATAELTSELSKADNQLKAFEQTLHEAPSYTLGANEGYTDAVSRASQQALNQIGRARAQRRMQRDVRRALGRTASAQDLQDANLPADAPVNMEAIRAAMERAVRRKRVNLSQHLGAISGDTATGYAGIEVGDLDTYYDPNGTVVDPGKRQAQRDMDTAAAAAERDRTIASYHSASLVGAEGKADESDRMTEAWRTGRARNLGVQVAGQFGGNRSPAEMMAAPIQGAAESVKSSFDTMTQGLSGFMDTLIESPEKAGEAAVNLAKGVLKGLAMMALQKSLFSTAEGIAALVTPGGQAAAAGFFTAAGIYAGVAAASGAAAAGIGAAQRGAQPTPASSGGGSASGPASAGGSRGGGSRDNRPIVINVNGAVMDREGFANAVLDGVNDAIGRGGRMAS